MILIYIYISLSYQLCLNSQLYFLPKQTKLKLKKSILFPSWLFFLSLYRKRLLFSPTKLCKEFTNSSQEILRLDSVSSHIGMNALNYIYISVPSSSNLESVCMFSNLLNFHPQRKFSSQVAAFFLGYPNVIPTTISFSKVRSFASISEVSMHFNGFLAW